MVTKKLQKPELMPLAKMLFPEAQNRIDKGKCPLCGADINGVDEFKDEASMREYGLSGFCQACQDKTFG